jgi:hypothetical protein
MHSWEKHSDIQELRHADVFTRKIKVYTVYTSHKMMSLLNVESGIGKLNANNLARRVYIVQTNSMFR